ncbi:hypothetical protein DFH07DRAFT_781179 [Mycena maculata]|uniref:Uncharacterized protein n=1 Tax=Mycena maculata TaxID=230809 RepID=A0AAD7HZM6_9AGAR|nr:hypothetical protein DFH07DRAFT_781179 [Mycena maculata]
MPPRNDETDLDKWIVDEQAEDNTRGMRRDQEIDFGQLATSSRVSLAEKRHAENVRDAMAQSMWEDYKQSSCAVAARKKGSASEMYASAALVSRPNKMLRRVRSSAPIYPPFKSSKANLRAASTFFVGDMADDLCGANVVAITFPIPSTERPRARIDSGPVVLARLLLQGASTSSDVPRFKAEAEVTGMAVKTLTLSRAMNSKPHTTHNTINN